MRLMDTWTHRDCPIKIKWITSKDASSSRATDNMLTKHENTLLLMHIKA